MEQPSADTRTGDEYFHVIRWHFSGPAELLPEWTEWYNNEHIPAILAVPGMRSLTRYAQLDSQRDFLTVWRMDGPHVLEEQAYADARGWGPWEKHIDSWTISLLEHSRPPRRFGAAKETDPPL